MRSSKLFVHYSRKTKLRPLVTSVDPDWPNLDLNFFHKSHRSIWKTSDKLETMESYSRYSAAHVTNTERLDFTEGGVLN